MGKAISKEKQAKINIRYDEEADVLYISFGKPRSGIAVELNDGDLVRVDPYSDQIVGITILDFKTRFMRGKRSYEKSAKELIPKIMNEFKEMKQ
jgi:uncharacterized protein YuzE